MPCANVRSGNLTGTGISLLYEASTGHRAPSTKRCSCFLSSYCWCCSSLCDCVCVSASVLSPVYIYSLLLFSYQSFGFFGYSKRHQHNWPREFKDCGGKLQSPIELSPSKAILLPLPSLELFGYHNYLPRLSVVNNGHSVSLNVEKNSLNAYGKKLPFIFGSVLDDDEEFEFSGLHFHWGLKNSRGSEHVVNGIRYPMEMHIIHRNKLYTDIEEAQGHKNGLVVLGIFFQLQDNDNNNLNPILKNFQSLKWIDSQLKLNVSLTLKSLLPDIDTYYSYKGSLTTPPCSEAVTWIIFTNPVAISFKQLNKFRSLSNGEDILGDNYRSIQDLGKRKIYLRKLTDDFASNYESLNINISSLEWFWE